MTREQLSLLESFLRARGNLKEMERELGISYPTVRARVDALVRSLGLGDGTDTADEPEDAGLEPAADARPTTDAGPATDAGAERRAILERLARGEIDAEAAAAEIRALSEA
jgi:hypothetical protein